MNQKVEEVYEVYEIQENLSEEIEFEVESRIRCKNERAFEERLIVNKKKHRRLGKMIQVKNKTEFDLGVSIFHQNSAKNHQVSGSKEERPIKLQINCSGNTSMVKDGLFSCTFANNSSKPEIRSESKIKKRLKTAKDRAVTFKNFFKVKKEISRNKIIFDGDRSPLSSKNGILNRRKKLRAKSCAKVIIPNDKNYMTHKGFYSHTSNSNLRSSYGNLIATSSKFKKPNRKTNSDYSKILMDKIVKCSQIFQNYEGLHTFSVNKSLKLSLKQGQKPLKPRYMHEENSPDYTAINKIRRLVRSHQRNFLKNSRESVSQWSTTTKASMASSSFARGISKKRLNRIISHTRI
ncbi:unnamed protein product [Moneuplotes crassus]|uniref:Uncharacterized protein n=1 Tax=Euplotes crassus TaxID=5936 RepID=A0AAD1UN44_EUPCR|nr:unnamed protein product [Moneuplotes crassus]